MLESVPLLRLIFRMADVLLSLTVSALPMVPMELQTSMASLDIQGLLQAQAVVVNLVQMHHNVIIAVAAALTAAFVVLTVVVVRTMLWSYPLD